MIYLLLLLFYPLYIVGNFFIPEYFELSYSGLIFSLVVISIVELVNNDESHNKLMIGSFMTGQLGLLFRFYHLPGSTLLNLSWVFYFILLIYILINSHFAKEKIIVSINCLILLLIVISPWVFEESVSSYLNYSLVIIAIISTLKSWEGISKIPLAYKFTFLGLLIPLLN